MGEANLSAAEPPEVQKAVVAASSADGEVAASLAE